MKKVLLAIAALSLMVISVAGCPQVSTSGNGSVGNSGTSSATK